MYTHTTLTEAMKSFAEDTDAEYVSYLGDFIEKAETRVLRDLDLELFEQWLDLSISGGIREVEKPTDVIFINQIFYRGPSTQKWIEVPPRSFEYCIMYQPTEDDTGPPAYFAELDAEEVYVVPTPDQTYAGGNAKGRCTIRPTGLSAANQTTWLSEHVGDLLFSACMVEAYSYLKHGEAMKKEASKYQSLLPGVQREIEDKVRKRYKETNNGKQAADD